MIYGEDQCLHCGGIRANKSSLCVSCLVRVNGDLQLRVETLEKKLRFERARELAAIMQTSKEIIELKDQLKLQRRLVQHIFEKYQDLQKGKMSNFWKGED